MLFYYGYAGCLYCFSFFEFALCNKTEGYFNLYTNYELQNRGSNFAKNNYCTEIFSKVFILQATTGGLVQVILAQFAISLVVVLVYLFSLKTHDCYQCLGKDLSSNYSIH